MRYPSPFLLPMLALLSLAGCAITQAPVAEVAPVAPIAVSCTENALSEQPCIAQARQKCASPEVDTIRLVLATPVAMEGGNYTKQRYDYHATYRCPESVTSAEPL